MLARKTLLNSISMYLDYAAKIIVTIVLAPILISTLGVSVYGAWQLILKYKEPLGALDGRPSEALKWIFINEGTNDHEESNRIFTSSLIVWLCFMPLFIGGAFAVYFLLSRTQDGHELHNYTLGFVIFFVALSVILSTIKSFFGGVLYGTNQTYRGMFVMTFATVVAAILIIWFAYNGASLVLIAGLFCIVPLLGAILSFYIVRKHVPWLSLTAISTKDVKRVFGVSVWYTVWTFLESLMVTLDFIAIGFYVGAEFIANYSVSIYGVQTITGLVLIFIGALIPSFKALIQKGNSSDVRKIRNEYLAFSCMIAVPICAFIILFNESIVSVWVGNGFYVGDLLNGVVAISVFILLLCRTEAMVFNIALDLKKKVKAGVYSCLIFLFLVLLLANEFGAIGICVSAVVSRLYLYFVYSNFVSSELCSEIGKFSIFSDRKIIVSIMLLILCWFLSFGVELHGIYQLFLSLIFVIGSVGIIFYYMGLSSEERKSIISRFSVLRGMIRR